MQLNTADLASKGGYVEAPIWEVDEDNKSNKSDDMNDC